MDAQLAAESVAPGWLPRVSVIMIRQRRPPFRITLLLGLVLITTALNIVRLFTAIAWKNTLAAYLPPLQVMYIGVTGAVWTLLGISVLWSFWRGGRYTRILVLAVAVLYAGWSWLDRLLSERAAQSNWPFDLVMTVLALGFVGFVVLDRHNQPYFGRETHERKRKNQSTT
jgi:hypothetical protein